MNQSFKAVFWSFLVSGFLAGCSSPDTPISQITNSTGGDLYQAQIGNVLFEIGGLMGTDFRDVAEGTNAVTVTPTSTSGTISVGSLGPFEKRGCYAVNIIIVGGNYCAELWTRNAGTEFENDQSRVLVSGSCP